MRHILTIILLIGSCSAHSLEIDKEKHFSAGVVMGVVDWKLGCGAGLAKEAHDSRGNGDVEFADFAYTCAGAALTHVLGRDRGYFYRGALAVMLLDGISTSGAMRNPNAYESSPFWNKIFARRPSDHEILAMTVFNIGLLELSEIYLDPLARKVVQAAIIYRRSKIVRINFEIARW